MAHECPDCGCYCHCNGDIDDLCLNLQKDQSKCEHCDFDPDYSDEDDPNGAPPEDNQFGREYEQERTKEEVTE